MKTRAFSLMELLIVVGVIGVLVAVGVVSFSRAAMNSRDSRRRADVQAVSQAIDQYYLQNDQQYPLTANCSGITDYLQTKNLPKDPDPSRNYDFSNACADDGYCVCALMEVVGSGNAYTPTVSVCNWSGSGDRDYYCINNKQ